MKGSLCCSLAFKRMLVIPSSPISSPSSLFSLRTYATSPNINISSPSLSSPSSSNSIHYTNYDDNNRTFRLNTLNNTNNDININGTRQFCDTSNRDWRDKFLNTYDLNAVSNRKTENVIADWRYNWECFWEDSSEIPLDPNKDYVFKHDLELWNCGFVHSSQHFDEFPDDINYSELCEDFDLLNELKEFTTVVGSTWHPSGYNLFPIIIKFDGNKELNPQSVLEALSAHEQIKQPGAIVEHYITDTKDCFFSRKTAEANNAIEEWFQKNFQKSYIAFEAGVQTMNPVPWVCVGKTNSGNLIGLISALDISKKMKMINWNH